MPELISKNVEEKCLQLELAFLLIFHSTRSYGSNCESLSAGPPPEQTTFSIWFFTKANRWHCI